jgi:hypothetical protein
MGPGDDERAERVAAWRRRDEYLAGGLPAASTASVQPDGGTPAGGEPAPATTSSDPPPTATNAVLPFARYSPSAGVTVDRTGNRVTIAGTIELSGESASPARARSMEKAINDAWTHDFGAAGSVTCDITVCYRPPGSRETGVTQVYAGWMLGPSETANYGRHDVYLNSDEADAFTWTAAHEFGHVVGLKDRYIESLFSRVRGEFGGTRAADVEPGYEHNLMGEQDGALGAQNVSDIASESEPSPLWIHDDDQVRDWVSAHTLAEIGGLSVHDKLTAIATLQGGWISDDDLEAMRRVCASVTSHDEGQALRSGVDLVRYTDIGQRTQMRVYLAEMP